ncbi:helix-turn-helix transcriptional regulator [Streptomyces sp. NBS 14/10]|uniref:helix-turn-helix domain-containing protein n=1 Tax=Streptomyces sp. NBS 14/10 TaxID=1945643 RepID=UPI000B7EB2DB|nr:helix-turn-helix transcriptional regulator [Streptomyces sp. NBS 14/10]KAK1182007.1 helix-turn-helix transcriptional regulator [Streptomyces sp. NBS 14/10]NUP40708.1 helix-turn-helix domain-containing protein [Streptomyces sp.]NUS88012.1 helix-turn-helix domain-containing protein [Streptomyces sp.]
MPMRSLPTARQLRLGTELRRLRERAGMSSTEAGRLLGTNQTTISNIEASRLGVSADRLRALARNYSCADEALITALIGMAVQRRRGWWEEYREILPTGLLDLAELEHHALALRTAYIAHLPGLLQTAEHAREIFRQVVPTLPPPEVEHRVSHRVKRQAILYGGKPTAYTAIVHEAALRMRFGGPDTARAQLQHILDMSEHEHIKVAVIPFEAGSFPGSGQSMLYAVGPVPQLDTVQLDTEYGSELLDAPAQLERYRVVLDRMETVALPESRSRDLVQSIIRSLKGE